MFPPVMLNAPFGPLFSPDDFEYVQAYPSPINAEFSRDETVFPNDILLSSVSPGVAPHDVYSGNMLGIMDTTMGTFSTQNSEIRDIFQSMAHEMPQMKSSKEPDPNIAPTSAALPQVAVQPRNSVRKYECGISPNAFDRPSRMENCRNRHSGARPHECLGRCGTSGWYVIAYSPSHF
jgi:hypothetical protein